MSPYQVTGILVSGVLCSLVASQSATVRLPFLSRSSASFAGFPAKARKLDRSSRAQYSKSLWSYWSLASLGIEITAKPDW